MEERIPRRHDPVVSLSPGEETDGDSDDGGSEFEFEFEFPSLLGRDHGSPAPADDLFVDGRIRPAAFYPVFGRRPAGEAAGGASMADDGLAPAAAPATERRKRGQLGRLFLEESRAWNSSSSSSTGSTASTSSSSSAATDDGLEGAAQESYCVWAPGGGKSSESPRPPRAGKSGSTGSSVARWRRISDLVVGRSQSDGKEKFLFLPVNPPAPPPKPNNPRSRPPNPAVAGSKKDVAPASEIGTVAAAHRMAYGAKAGVAAGATPRRTFLPYREELVGFFANVNGISRSHAHPY